MQDKARDASPPLLVALRGHVVVGVLGQNVEAPRKAALRFEIPSLEGISQRRKFEQFEGVGGHAVEPRRTARMVSAAPGPLPSSSHALGTTDLDHLGDGAKVDPKIQA